MSRPTPARSRCVRAAEPPTARPAAVFRWRASDVRRPASGAGEAVGGATGNGRGETGSDRNAALSGPAAQTSGAFRQDGFQEGNAARPTRFVPHQLAGPAAATPGGRRAAMGGSGDRAAGEVGGPAADSATDRVLCADLGSGMASGAVAPVVGLAAGSADDPAPAQAACQVPAPTTPADRAAASPTGSPAAAGDAPDRDSAVG